MPPPTSRHFAALSTSDLTQAEVFPAIITDFYDDVDDDPDAGVYVFPKRYKWRKASMSGVDEPDAVWRMEADQNVPPDPTVCSHYLDGDATGQTGAVNVWEILFLDGGVRYLPLLPGTPVLMMKVRPPVLDALPPAGQTCPSIIVPTITPVAPWLFYFNQAMDPECTYCDCVEGEPCPPDEP